MTAIASTLWLLAALPAAALSADEARARALLGRAQAATGGDRWESVRGLRYRTEFENGGRSWTRDSWVDLLVPRFLTVERQGRAELRDGYDGRWGWRQAQGLALLSRDQQETRTAAYMKARAYWFPSRWPASFRYLGARAEGEATLEAVEIVPEGAAPVEIEFDAGSGLPYREIYRRPSGATRVRYGGYRSIRGLLLPMKAGLEGPDGFRLEARTLDVELDPPLGEELFKIPAPAPSFDALSSSAVVEARYGAVVQARVNGAGPFPFVLDTGGFAHVTPALAEAAGLRDGATAYEETGTQAAAQDRAPRHAEGEPRPQAAQRATIQIGGLTLRDLPLVVSARLADGLPSELREARTAGLLGFETFVGLAVTIDASRERAVFEDPARARPPEASIEVPFDFFGTRPVVEADLDGERGRFVLDTGSSGSVVLNPAFAARSPLRERYGAGKPVEVLFAFGRAMGRQTRERRLTLGPLQLTNVSVILLEVEPRGLQGLSGLIGMELLRRYRVTFDYSRQKAFLE